MNDTTENLPDTIPALPVSPALKGFDLIPTTFAEAKEFAEFIATSELVPKDYRGKAADIFVAIQMGMDVGLRPLQAIQNIAVINGRPVMWGDAVLAVVRGSGCLDWIEESLDAEAKTAICRVKRVGEEPIERHFSLDDAKRANLTGKPGPWQQYPRRMLQMRARSWALRDAFADVLKGIHVREEVEDHSRTIQGEAVSNGAAAVNERLKSGGKALASIQAQHAVIVDPVMLKPPVFDDSEPERSSATPLPASVRSGEAPTLDEVARMMREARGPDDLEVAQSLMSHWKRGTKERQMLADLEADTQRRLGA